MTYLRFCAFVTLILLFSCENRQEEKPLFDGFQNPPAEARPFVRWWWNGNQLEATEIVRQIEVLHQAGIGGVEINPIAMAAENPDIGIESLEWLSPEWNAMLKVASKELKERGMIADLIVGSGWPFGGEFLKPDEMIQRILVEHITVSGPGVFTRDSAEMLMEVVEKHRDHGQIELNNELMFIKLVPVKASGLDEMKNLGAAFTNGKLSFEVPEGDYELVFGLLQVGHRGVQLGAKGAAGPVMDHYDAAVVKDYLARLKKIEEDTGIPLAELIRALFCDSIELAGANWADSFAEIFEQTYGYSLQPYLPFVFYQPYQGYQENQYAASFQEELSRVRYDYNKLLVKIFLDNFTKTFHQFCQENNLLSRYQAYGTPFLMDMLEGYMIPDIPESNNWMFSADMERPDWTWNKGHGYMVWNMYTAAGGHLAGRKIISSEAMTNTKGVFKLTLEDMKQADDMNFITGINHSVLHGYNYSPQAAGFPGWIRFGAYYSEQNTWWPYLHHWSDYNARLNYVMQNSKPVKQIAVLGPVADLWSQQGLIRVPFHMEPWYLHELWQSFSQAGSSVEYINERIIREANKAGGELNFGPMTYQALIIASVGSMELATAQAIDDYVNQGGKLVILDSLPKRDPQFQFAENDSQVAEIFHALTSEHPQQVFFSEIPEGSDRLLPWTINLMEKASLPQDVLISNPDRDIYQIHQSTDQEEIFFFANSHRLDEASLQLQFDTPAKNLWCWNPEDGSKKLLQELPEDGTVRLQLAPLESMLLVINAEPGEVV
ncbi:MAG: glycosyl hydrolase, partial [Cyclobacteriaceae bacterium]